MSLSRHVASNSFFCFFVLSCIVSLKLTSLMQKSIPTARCQERWVRLTWGASFLLHIAFYMYAKSYIFGFIWAVKLLLDEAVSPTWLMKKCKQDILRLSLRFFYKAVVHMEASALHRQPSSNHNSYNYLFMSSFHLKPFTSPLRLNWDLKNYVLPH